MIHFGLECKKYAQLSLREASRWRIFYFKTVMISFISPELILMGIFVLNSMAWLFSKKKVPNLRVDEIKYHHRALWYRLLMDRCEWMSYSHLFNYQQNPPIFLDIGFHRPFQSMSSIEFKMLYQCNVSIWHGLMHITTCLKYLWSKRFIVWRKSFYFFSLFFIGKKSFSI